VGSVATAGRGRLAEVIASRGGRAALEAPFVIEHREALSMSFAFNLSCYDDVRANAEAIYEKLAAGSMPCDGPWPAEDVEGLASAPSSTTARRRSVRPSRPCSQNRRTGDMMCRTPRLAQAVESAVDP
jgi:hypothetical protein